MGRPAKIGAVPASNFISTMVANVDNPAISDAEFRAMFRRTLPIVEYDSRCSCGKPGERRWDKGRGVSYCCDDCWKS